MLLITLMGSCKDSHQGTKYEGSTARAGDVRSSLLFERGGCYSSMELAKGMSIAAGSTLGTMSDSYRVRTPGGLSTWLPLPVWWPEGAGQLEGRHTRETLGHLWARASRSLKKHVGQWKQWGPPLPSYRQTKSFEPLGDVVSIHLGELSQDSNPLLVEHISCDHFPSGGQANGTPVWSRRGAFQRATALMQWWVTLRRRCQASSMGGYLGFRPKLEGPHMKQAKQNHRGGSWHEAEHPLEDSEETRNSKSERLQ